MKTVSVVLLNFNGEKNTNDCLSSISKLKTEGLELSVIVVDNGSTDAEASVISNFQFPISNEKIKVKVIKNKRNLGFSGGNNIGIKSALENGADYVVVLNNDTIVDKNLIIEMLKTATSDNKIGIVAPKIYFARGFEFHKNRYKEKELGKVIWYAGGLMNWKNVVGYHRGVDEVDKGQFENSEETEYASGCCMMIKREVLERVGMFDDKYFLYYEDADLSMRVKKSGYTIIYTPKALLWHKNAASSGGSGSELQDYYITRNRMLFGMRYAPLKSKMSLFKESLSLFLNGRKWQKKGILDFYLDRFGKGTYKE